MKTKLTNRFLESLTPPETGRLEVSDTERKGLRFRLSATGKAVWMYEKRVKGGQKRKHTLGHWPKPVGLSEARKMALEIEAEAAQGIDRIANAEAERREKKRTQASTLNVSQVLDIYDTIHLSSLRTRDERLRQLRQSLFEHLDGPITDLTRSDIQRAVDAKASAGRKAYANRIRAALSAFSNWAWVRGYISENIASGVAKATTEHARERVLSIGEIRKIWTATFEMGPVWGPVFRLLLLTCQRRGEILGLRWEEIDFDDARMTKPGSQTKNKKPHITHLSGPALKELRALHSKDANTGFVFTTTGDTPVSGIGKAKARLDKLLPDDFEHWRIHDIRTGFATKMADAGENEAVVDRILNHSATASAPTLVGRVYNQAQLLDQRAVALDKWAELVTQESADVVAIGGRGD